MSTKFEFFFSCSLDSFRNGDLKRAPVPNSSADDYGNSVSAGNSKLSARRLFSIPDVLLNATLTHNR